MAFISVDCSCGKSFKVESAKAGRKIRCGCGAVLLVPDPTLSPAPEALDVSESAVEPKRAARLPRRAEVNTQSYEADNKSKMVKLAFLAAGFIVICLGLSFAYSRMKPAPITFKGQDAEATAFIRDATEAREWLKGRDMMLGGYLHKQAEHHINQWYEMGVKTIYTKGRPAAWVVMELPAETDKRTVIFDWYVKFVRKTNEIPVKDEGQQYLMVRMPVGNVN